MNSRQQKILFYMNNIHIKSSFDFYYSDGNEIDLIYYYGNKNKIKIPNLYNGMKIKSIESSCFNSNQEITDLVIAEGIEAIY